MGRLNERAKEMEGLYFLETSDGSSGRLPLTHLKKKNSLNEA